MMSDVEEPPTKVLKMEVQVVPSSLDSTMEGQEEGQEEWLSEGVLTDDDYLPVSHDQIAANINDALNSTALDTDEGSQPEVKPEMKPVNVKTEHNIEDTLNDFEADTEPAKEDPFDALLKKQEKHSDAEHSERQSDDGHDTDDLLRMLGGDDGRMKKKVLTSIRDKKARREPDHSSDDDDYLFEGAKVTKLTVAKNALIRKQPIKAEPEGLSDGDSDMSDDEGSTVKRMFGTKPRASLAAGAAPKSARPCTNNAKTEKPTPTTKYTNTKSLLKPRQPEEVINEEEYLEEDDFDLDDDMGEASPGAQALRRPERMDEEPPSDDDSHSEDDSLYEGMPSSDSEDMDDWFTLDIRAERAGDYLPWLGENAHKLLTEEKHRVTARLAALRHSVSALRSSERVQSDQLKVAAEAVHELDAMLAAA